MKITPIFLLLFIGFGLRLCIAIWNGFYGPSFGADLDALTFHKVAIEYANNPALVSPGVGWIYSYLLGKFYSITTGHIFLGSLLSCIAWLLSAFFLLKTLNLFAINKRNKYLALLIYVILPSSLLYTSVTLREVYQLLFVNIMMYSALMILIRRSSVHWMLFCLGVVGAGAFHGALTAFSIILTVLLLLFLAFTSYSGLISWKRLILEIPLIVAILVFSVSIITTYAYQIDDGIINSAVSYQNKGLEIEARASYKTEIPVSSTFEVLMFIPVSLFQYLFEPMPWKISSVVDIPVFLENILRFWLILTAISLRYYRPILFILLAYFALEGIWSLGTVNWGTASRHHISSIGMLLVAAFVNRNIKRKQVQVKR